MSGDDRAAPRRGSWRGAGIAGLLVLGLVVELALRGPLAAPSPEPSTEPPTGQGSEAGRQSSGYDVLHYAVLHYDVLHYDADLKLDLEHESIAGRVEIELESLEDGLRRVDLDAGALEIRSVVDGSGTGLVFERRDRKLGVELATAAQAGEIVRLRIDYEGHPDRGVRFRPDQVFTYFHTSSWLVTRDVPGDKATLDLALTVPAGLEVVASGRELGTEPGHEPEAGAIRHRFSLDRPYSPYLYGFAAGHFAAAEEVVDGVRLRYLGVGFTPEELRRVFADTGEMLRFFTAKAGVPYPGVSYTQVLLDGAPPQEMAGLSVMSTAYGRSVLEDPREDYLVAHELAHQWWGNELTCATWSDFWLNEGVASFLSAAFKEQRWGRDEYDRERFLARQRYRRALEAGPGRPLVHEDWTEPGEMGGALTYSRGLLVLHYLRRSLGEEVFWDGLRRYTRAGIEPGAGRGSGSTVTSADLEKALSAAAGRSLEPEFARWVYGGDMPLVTAEHHRLHGAVEITLEQRVEQGGEQRVEQRVEPWPLSLDLAVEGSDGRTRRRVLLEHRRQTFVLPVEGELLSVRVDEGGQLPRPVEQTWSPRMLRWQVTGEPELLDRAEALLALEQACAGASSEPACTDRRALFRRLAASAPERLMRQLAVRAAARLEAAGDEERTGE